MLFAPLNKIDAIVMDHDPQGILAQEIAEYAERGEQVPRLLVAS